MIKQIIASASKMIQNDVVVNANAQRSAFVYKTLQLFSGAASSVQFVRDWLIHKVPRVQGIVERLRGHELLMNGKQLDAEVARFGQQLTLLLNVLVRPAKHFGDRSLLTIPIIAWP